MTTDVLQGPIVSEGLSDRDFIPKPTGATLGYGDTLSGRIETHTLEFSFSGGTVILEGEPEVLNWYRPICQDLFNLLSLRPNWDSYGAYAIEIETVVSALNILDGIAGLNTPRPSVVPTARGGIQLEWHTKGIDLEIELDPAGKGSVFYENKFGKIIEKEGKPKEEMDLLIELIAELST